jgi:bifunctional non-homologous end joining protein LigD
MASFRPSNLDKVFWPGLGITKGDLLGYMEAAAHALVPALRDRPLTVKRYPDGIDAFSFFQKNTPAHAPSWVKRIRLRAESAKRDVDYTVCNSKRTLLWLANQAAIELHPWPTRADRLGFPDLMVFDFDPPEEGFPAAVEAALAMKEVLDEQGLRGAAKTSGSKGVHLYVPLRRRHPFQSVGRAAERLAEEMAGRHPRLATTEFAKAGRKGRVLIDVRRNAPGQHTVAPYSPRARPAATVSFPVDWRDLDRVRPEDFTIRSAPERLADGADPWRDLLPRAQSLPSSLTEP